MIPSRHVSILTLLTFLLPASPLVTEQASAFCGFYVAKADTRLFNEASQVVLVRDGDRTVLTMANDYKGEPEEFAIVVPVPTFLERGQIHIGNPKTIEHLDAYTAPRLVEYFDSDPCRAEMSVRRSLKSLGYGGAQETLGNRNKHANTLGVTIEAAYTVGEYDIEILSAKQSGGLETFLRESGYKLPRGASRILGSYLKQGMRFFVAKVNIEEQSKLGYSFLRPLQVAYESPKFMLPIRLGTLNADGKQELFVYTLTRKGRVETTNYRTVKLPSGNEIPVHVKDDFGSFYKAMFRNQTKKEKDRAVFLEYAWDVAWCDPCAADPLSNEELRELGVYWVGEPAAVRPRPVPRPGSPQNRVAPTRPPRPIAPRQAADVFVTRLHVRYDAAHFPEDLVFQETADRTNFQGRYILRHAWKGGAQCQAADRYRRDLPVRWEKEAQTLARLTGWDINKVRGNMDVTLPSPPAKEPWWKRIWRDSPAKR